MSRIDPATITAASPKKLVTAAVAGGYEVRAFSGEEFVKGEVFKSGPNAGDRRPDKTINWLYVAAKAPGVAMMATYKDGRYQEALAWDSVGWPTELHADYTIADQQRKRVGLTETKAAERTARMDAEYNDGSVFTNNAVRLVTAAGDFEEWAAEVVPGFTARKRVTKAQESNEIKIGSEVQL